MSAPRLMLCFIAVAAMATIVGWSTARADTWAVIVGVDNYKYIRGLRGAENDARDIMTTLEKRGVKNITALFSAQASRRSVLEAIDATISKVQRGNLVIIAFAGHGASEHWGKTRPADVAFGETYEVFLLPGFEPPTVTGGAPQRGSFSERILDREIHARLSAFEKKGARVIFLADVCHAGGLTRDVEPQVEAAESYRFQPPYPTLATESDVVVADVAKTSLQGFEHLKDLPNLTFLAAVDETKKAPEVQIPEASGTWRGALSYAFARAIEGEADTDHDRRLTRQELFYYLRTNVRQISMHRQEPELQPDNGSAVVAVELQRDLPSSQAAPAEAPSSSHVVRIFVDGGAQALPSSRVEGVKIERADNRADADLVWTPQDGTMMTAGGDLVAEKVRPSMIDAIAEREVARREILTLARGRPLELTVDGGDGIRHSGDRVVARAQLSSADCGAGATGGATCRDEIYYVLFNIAGDGTLQYLFPHNRKIDNRFTGSSDPVTLDVAFPVLRMKAGPPFGTDLLVLVASPTPLLKLAGALSGMNSRSEPLDAVEALKRLLPNNATIATQSIFTRP